MFALNNRGVAYQAKGDYDRAIIDHDEAIRLDRGFAVAYYSRGHAYQAKHEIDRAIADYDQAIRLQPNYAAALYWRGMAKRLKGGDAGGDADIAAAKTTQSGTLAVSVGRSRWGSVSAALETCRRTLKCLLSGVFRKFSFQARQDWF